ncbi:hypothetical protein BBP40_000960 [Aspergillus hancockii]|nr:hypothetical protein BBP40_000960 [Aspergillus hancockii]
MDLEEIDDRDIEAAQALILMASATRRPDIHHEQHASFAQPSRGNSRQDPIEIDIARIEQITPSITNAPIHPPSVPIARTGRQQYRFIQQEVSARGRVMSAGHSDQTQSPSRTVIHSDQTQTPARPTPHPDEALQAYLVRQQLLAGIAPENVTPMRTPRADQPQGRAQDIVNNPNEPSVVQVTNDGIVIPYIQPAAFNGVLHPLPVRPDQLTRSSILPRQGPRCGSNFSGVMTSHSISNLRAEAQTPHSRQSASFEGSSGRLSRGQIIESPSQQLAPRRGSNFSIDMSSQSASNLRTQTPLSRQCASFEGSSGPSGRVSRELIFASPNRSAEEGSTETLRIVQRYNDSYSVSRERERQGPRLQLFPTLTNGILRSPLTSDSGQDTVEIPHNGFDILLSFTYHKDVALKFMEYLEIKGLINLFAISKPFHLFVKRHFMDIINGLAKHHADESALIFPPRCYPKLCTDLTSTRRQSLSARSASTQSRLVPSFRWLQMIIHREMTVRNIMGAMLRAGHGLPKRCEPAIKKMWFLMDIPDNKRRQWTVENRNVWEDIDVFFAILFIAQLDVVLRKKRSNITGRMFRLLLAQPTLTELWDVLRNASLRSDFDTLKAYVRWRYAPAESDADMHIYGVPPHEVGALQFEGYGRNEKTVILLRPDELVLRELSKRQLNMGEMYKNIFLYGDPARYHSRSTPHPVPWDTEIQLEAEKEGMTWQSMVILD